VLGVRAGVEAPPSVHMGWQDVLLSLQKLNGTPDDPFFPTGAILFRSYLKILHAHFVILA
jgi:hypothetical protein